MIIIIGFARKEPFQFIRTLKDHGLKYMRNKGPDGYQYGDRHGCMVWPAPERPLPSHQTVTAKESSWPSTIHILGDRRPFDMNDAENEKRNDESIMGNKEIKNTVFFGAMTISSILCILFASDLIFFNSEKG